MEAYAIPGIGYNCRDVVASDVIVVTGIEVYASIIIQEDVVARDDVPAGWPKSYAITVHADVIARDGVAVTFEAYTLPVVRANVVARDIVIIVTGIIESYASITVRVDAIIYDSVVDVGFIEE